MEQKVSFKGETGLLKYLGTLSNIYTESLFVVLFACLITGEDFSRWKISSGRNKWKNVER